MGFFKRLIRKAERKDRVFALGLEGISLPFAIEAAQSGLMPNLGDIMDGGVNAGLDPVLPAVGTVEWACYASGCLPGKHGVFGFVDRQPDPFQVHIPDARDLKAPPFWDALGRAGKRVGIMNLPLTYPPKALNGFMVGCSLSPDLAKATYPVELAPRLMEMDYRIEADAGGAFEDPDGFFDSLSRTMASRFNACLSLMETEAWDFFHLHISTSDLMNYFFWPEAEPGEHFLSYYRKLDGYLGELAGALPRGCRLVLASAHGFCSTRALVYVNRWLEENGYLLFGRGKRSLVDMHPDSRAYSLVPGRVYLNLAGREQRGSVAAGRPYEDLREELIHRIGGLSHPETGEPLVEAVHRREDIYAGHQVNLAADLIIEPRAGFDLKANLDGPGVLGPPELPGMHMTGGGFLSLGGLDTGDIQTGPANLADAAPTILALLDVAPPAQMEGRSLV